MNARYTELEIWTKLLAFEHERIDSLTGKSAHRIVSVDRSEKSYQIAYESTKSWPKPITLSELYALYCELYSVSELSNRYMEGHCRRVLGWARWHAPGSAMMAVLPLLDDNIDVVRGELHIRSCASVPADPLPTQARGAVRVVDIPATTSVPGEKITSQQRAGHNMHCKGCKVSVETMLKKLYGQVSTSYKLDLGTRPQDFKNSGYYRALADILWSLEKHRGFTGFIRSTTLPNVDFFVPDPGFIVEFDESQHFTIPRRVALDKYPPSLQLGYNRDRWSALCARIKAHDPDPPFRDEQRAWYDTLRDFAPAFLGLRPTVRLHAGDRVWCDLDPARPDHVQLFRSLIEGSIDSWIIQVRDASEARVARVILTYAWEGDLRKAWELLDAISRSWPEGRRVDFLITCGGFVQFDLASIVSPMDARKDPASALDLLLGEANRIAAGFLERGLANRFIGKVRYITLGIDSYKDKISTTQTLITQPHAEMVALLDLKTGQTHCTAKSYPTPGQEMGLLRSTDLLSHFIQSDDGRTIMILGCHDLSMFNPRGIANATGWRAAVGSDFRSLAKKLGPRVVLQHPHITESVQTWAASWNRLMDELPSVELYASAGRYWRQESPRSALEDVLARTTSAPTLDFIVSTHGL